MPADNEIPEWMNRWIGGARIQALNKLRPEHDNCHVVVWLADALDRAQRERNAIAARTYDACIAIAEKVASHTDDLMRGAVRTQSSGGAGHAIGYGSAAREVVEQIEELRRAWPVLPDTTVHLASHTPPEGKND